MLLSFCSNNSVFTIYIQQCALTCGRQKVLQKYTQILFSVPVLLVPTELVAISTNHCLFADWSLLHTPNLSRWEQRKKVNPWPIKTLICSRLDHWWDPLGLSQHQILRFLFSWHCTDTHWHCTVQPEDMRPNQESLDKHWPSFTAVREGDHNAGSL